jgi:hypothetical protein
MVVTGKASNAVDTITSGLTAYQVNGRNIVYATTFNKLGEGS